MSDLEKFLFQLFLYNDVARYIRIYNNDSPGYAYEKLTLLKHSISNKVLMVIFKSLYGEQYTIDDYKCSTYMFGKDYESHLCEIINDIIKENIIDHFYARIGLKKNEIDIKHKDLIKYTKRFIDYIIELFPMMSDKIDREINSNE